MPDETPTVVLVHGAFADGSSWNGVIQRLRAKGVRVTAPANRCGASRLTPRIPRACSRKRRARFWPSAIPTAVP